MRDGVRESWLADLNRECQVLIGETTRTRPLRTVFSEFTERLPEAHSRIEAALLRGRLIDLCLRWGDAYHRQYHSVQSIPIDRCKLRPNDVTSQV